MTVSITPHLLDLVSRSFAICIARLPSGLRDEIGVFYLMCRYADTIEDSRFSPEEKSVLFERFLPVVEANDLAGLEALSSDLLPGVIQEGDREMVSSFGSVLSQFHSFESGTKSIGLRWLSEMVRGMDAFGHRPIETFDDLDEYCYFVAGTVGYFGTELLMHKFHLHFPGLHKRCRDFGLLLQKVNIIRDFSRDYSEGRVFWPRQLFAKHDLSVEDVFKPENESKRLAILSEMVADARKHYGPSVAYLKEIPDGFSEVRVACAIPFFMAVPTLDLCANNASVFDPNAKVKLSREQTSAILQKVFLANGRP